MPTANKSNHGWVIVPSLMALVFAAYAGVWGHQFVLFDDIGNLTENATVLHGLTWRGWVWAWTSIEDSNWYPITKLSHMVGAQLFGLRPGPHLLFNALIHACNTALIWAVLSRMTGAGWRSAAVASLFAVHPLHVESVAWLSERKDVLFLFFELLAIGAYVRYAAKPSAWRYFPVFGFMALGLMSKPMVVSFPLLLLFLDVWPLGRIRGLDTGVREGEFDRRSPIQLIIEKIPLFILGAADCVITMIAQRTTGAVKDFDYAPMDLRFANTLVAYVSYLGKLFWPADLVALVPLPHEIPVPVILGSWAIMIGITIGVWWFARERPYLLMGWCWYIVSLIPVIGLVQVGGQARADRYMYLPSIGVYVIVVWGLYDLISSRLKLAAESSESPNSSPDPVTNQTPNAGTDAPSTSVDSTTPPRRSDGPSWPTPIRASIIAAWIVIVAGLLIATTRQVETWKDTDTLFTRVLDRYPDSVQGMNILASSMGRQKKYAQAIALYSRAIELDPRSWTSFNNLGTLLMRVGRFPDAIECFKASLDLVPDNFHARYNLGVGYASIGHFDEAIAQFDEAIRAYPDREEPIIGRASAMGSMGRWAEAEAGFKKGLSIQGQSADAWNGLGLVLMNTNRPDAAVECFQRANEISPQNPVIRSNLERAMKMNPGK